MSKNEDDESDEEQVQIDFDELDQEYSLIP